MRIRKNWECMKHSLLFWKICVQMILYIINAKSAENKGKEVIAYKY